MRGQARALPADQKRHLVVALDRVFELDGVVGRGERDEPPAGLAQLV